MCNRQSHGQMQSRAGTIQSVPETPDSLSGWFFSPAGVKSPTLKLPDVTIASVTAVSSHHTFISEMSYLKGNSSSICHPWCHHLSSVGKRVDLQRPSLNPTSPKLCPATIPPPWQLAEFDLCKCWPPNWFMQTLIRPCAQPVCLRPTRLRAQRRRVLRRSSVFGGNLESLLVGTEPPHVSSHVSTVTLCDHAWLEPQSHQPGQSDTTPLPINPPPPKNTLCVPQNLHFSRDLTRNQTQTSQKFPRLWKCCWTFNFKLGYGCYPASIQLNVHEFEPEDFEKWSLFIRCWHLRRKGALSSTKCAERMDMNRQKWIKEKVVLQIHCIVVIIDVWKYGKAKTKQNSLVVLSATRIKGRRPWWLIRPRCTMLLQFLHIKHKPPPTRSCPWPWTDLGLKRLRHETPDFK